MVHCGEAKAYHVCTFQKTADVSTCIYVDAFQVRGDGTGTASTAVAVPLLWRMRLSRTKIGAILMTSLRLALALTPAAQDDKRGEKTKYRIYHRSSAQTKTRAVPSTLALSQGN